MPSLFEKYRPRSLSQVVGHDKAIATIRRLSDTGALAGRAYWLAGPSGTGKTSIARLIAAEIADDLGTEEIDAGALTATAVDAWRLKVANRPLFGRGWVLIVNEAHGLRKDVIRRLLCATEPLPTHAVVIFTTTNEGESTLFEEKIDASPLVSRCFEPKLERRGEALVLSFAIAVRNIARTENLDGQPLDRYIAFARKCKCNFREMLQKIEAGEMLA